MATLTWSMNASVTLGTTAYQIGPTGTMTVTDAISRAQTITTTKANFLTLGAADGAGQLTALKFLVVWNTDATNFVTIGIESASDCVYIKIPAGKAIMLNTKELDANTAGSTFSAFVDATAISAKADTASCIINFMAAN